VNCKAITMGLLLLVLATSARAITRDLGTVGATYPVIEPDILAELKENARQHQPNLEEIFKRIRKYQPPDLQRLPRAELTRTFLVDMTYTLKKPIRDTNGRVLYPVGFTFNPLDYTPFIGGLVIIDATDPIQVRWLRKTPYFKNHLVRILLCGGYALMRMEQWKRPVFYLTRQIASRLKATAVPAVVIKSKSKGKLQVTEIKIDNNNYQK